MQSEDFSWFVDNYTELFQKYGLCYIAIRDKNVLGTYQNAQVAINETVKLHPLGSFIIQFCNGDESGYTNYLANSQIAII